MKHRALIVLYKLQLISLFISAMAGREEELCPNPLGTNPTTAGMPPPNLTQGAHNFYAELLQGLDPSIAATIENQLPPLWQAYSHDPPLGTEAPINFGFGNWGTYANTFSAAEEFPGTYSGIPPQNLLNTMAPTGESQPTNRAENGFFNSFSMNSDGSPSPSLGFNAVTEDGQQLYSEAMSQWSPVPPTVSSAPNARSYDLFGPSDVFHEPEPAGQSRGHVGSPVPPPSASPSPIAPAPPTTSPPATSVNNTKPSYSDVTKNKPPVGKGKAKALSRASSAHSSKDEHITNPAASNSNHSGKSSSQRKGRSSRASLNRTKSVPFEPTTIQPNSR